MPAGNSSLYFSSGDDFILLPTWYGGLYGVLFDYGIKDIPLDVIFNLSHLSL